MLNKAPTASQQITQLAREVFQDCGDTGAEAQARLRELIRGDLHLMYQVAEDALPHRVTSELSGVARRERLVTIETNSLAYARRPKSDSLAAHGVRSLMDVTLPITGHPPLRSATCAQVWEAVDYYRSHRRDFHEKERWLTLVLGGRDRTDRPVITRSVTEARLQEYLHQAEAEAQEAV